MSLDIPLGESLGERSVRNEFNIYFSSGIIVTPEMEKKAMEIAQRCYEVIDGTDLIVMRGSETEDVRTVGREYSAIITDSTFLIGDITDFSPLIRIGRITTGNIEIKNMTALISYNFFGSPIVSYGSISPEVLPVSYPQPEAVPFRSLPEIIHDTLDKAKMVSKNLLIFSAFANAGVMMTNIIGNGFYPEIMIGFVPIDNVGRVEAAISDSKVKYRAIGDVFLAHQEGSLDSLRIDGMLTGPLKTMFLNGLLTLQYAGANDLKKIPSSGIQPLDPTSDVFKRGDVDPYIESHMTFPIITRSGIFLDMYIQTLEWHQEVMETGKDGISYHILLRKFVEPIGYHVIEPSRRKKQRFQLDYGSTKRESQRLENQLDSLWKSLKISIEMFRYGLTGGFSLPQLNMEAVASIPYVTDVRSLVGGLNWEKFFGNQINLTY